MPNIIMCLLVHHSRCAHACILWLHAYFALNIQWLSWASDGPWYEGVCWQRQMSKSGNSMCVSNLLFGFIVIFSLITIIRCTTSMAYSNSLNITECLHDGDQITIETTFMWQLWINAPSLKPNMHGTATVYNGKSMTWQITWKSK